MRTKHGNAFPTDVSLVPIKDEAGQTVSWVVAVRDLTGMKPAKLALRGVTFKSSKLMGVESNGMVLAASPEGGKPMLVGFDTPPDPGTRVR